MQSNVKFGLYTPNYGKTFGFASKLAELALEAEKAGWDGFFLWDHIFVSRTAQHDFVDPWIGLTAMASYTKKIRLGTTVTPLPRRRPWKLARETVSLDHFSNGRLTLSIGLGTPVEEEYHAFGEEGDMKVRGQKLDESLDILLKFWSGRKFNYTGKQFTITDVSFLPKPLQKPRIPIWGGGFWPNKKPFIRASRLDGIIPLRIGGRVSPQDFKDILKFIKNNRVEKGRYDVVRICKVPNTSSLATKQLEPYIESGVNWFLHFIGASAKYDVLLERIKLGPPDIKVI